MVGKFYSVVIRLLVLSMYKSYGLLVNYICGQVWSLTVIVYFVYNFVAFICMLSIIGIDNLCTLLALRYLDGLLKVSLSYLYVFTKDVFHNISPKIAFAITIIKFIIKISHNYKWLIVT